MIRWIDLHIFGNGHGLKSPYFDDVFYWLSGEAYTFSYGLGAQLQSFQWRHPISGERRRLAGRDFVVFSSTRRWFRVSVSWAMTDTPDDLDEHHKAIRKLHADLKEI